MTEYVQQNFQRAEAAERLLVFTEHKDTLDSPQLHLIQDPASKLSPKEEMSVVRYVVGQSDWRRAETGTSSS